MKYIHFINSQSISFRSLNIALLKMWLAYDLQKKNAISLGCKARLFSLVVKPEPIHILVHKPIMCPTDRHAWWSEFDSPAPAGLILVRTMALELPSTVNAHFLLPLIWAAGEIQLLCTEMTSQKNLEVMSYHSSYCQKQCGITVIPRAMGYHSWFPLIMAEISALSPLLHFPLGAGNPTQYTGRKNLRLLPTLFFQLEMAPKSENLFEQEHIYVPHQKHGFSNSANGGY